MPQRKQVTWAQLRVGLLTLVGLFLIMVAILYVTGAGILRSKYQLRTFLPEVEGLTLGAPVRLDGVEVGNVDGIRIAPPTSNPNRMRNVEVVMRVDRRFDKNITSESRASLVTEGFLGNRYVRITRGYTGNPIPPQGEVPGEEEIAMKNVVERGAELAKDVQALVTGLQKGQGTLGKLMTDDQLYNHMNATVTRLDTMLADTQRGNNSLGKLLANDEMYKRLMALADRVDAILAEVQDQKGTLGRLVYDPSLYQSVKDFSDKANAFITGVREGKGTFGKLTTDEQLYNNLRDTAASLKEATDKLNKGTGTFGKAMNDAQLYDNLTSLSAELKSLIEDIHKDPKKYLHIKMTIF